MRKLIPHLAALLLLLGVVVGTTAASEAPNPAAVAHPSSAPTRGCTTTATAPNLVERCGACTVLGFANSSQRDATIHALTAASSESVWLTVGSDWIGGTDATDLAGAILCSDKLGGNVERF